MEYDISNLIIRLLDKLLWKVFEKDLTKSFETLKKHSGEIDAHTGVTVMGVRKETFITSLFLT